ncbi:MAG: DNA internalization-related competence protein ComEC/Rec2 [Woeseiaceae bacterium]
MMKKACLTLLAGLYAPQLSSFASHSDLFPLLVFALFAAFLAGRLVYVLLVAAGYLMFVAVVHFATDARISPDNVGDSIMAVVHIADFPQRRGSTVTFAGRVDDNPWVPARIRLSWFEPGTAVEFGDTWRLELRLRRPRGNANPGVFDYESWLFRNGYAATGYVVDSARNRKLASQGIDFLAELRRKAVQRIVESGIKTERAAVLAAISVGARHLLTRDQWDRYAQTGTSHLMAISGLHVGMVAVAGYFLSRIGLGIVRHRGSHHRLATLTGLLCAITYALASGTGIPAQRATLMIGLAALAMFVCRRVRPFRIVALACFTVVIISPLETMAPGFMLSFAAVVVLLWIARQRSVFAHGNARLLVATAVLANVQVALLLGLLPLTVLLFDRVAVVAPLANLVAVPVFSLGTVPLTFMGLLSGGAVGNLLLQLASWTLGVVEWVIDVARLIPGSSSRIPELLGASMGLLAAPLMWVLLPPGWPGRAIAWLGLLAIVSYTPPRPAPACVQIDVLDVGQGLATVATTRSATLLFDTGPAFRGGGDAAESVIVPFLQGRGVDRLDHVVVSHADLDHAGGIGTVLRSLGVGSVYVGEDLGLGDGERACRAGEAWSADRIRFEFLYPPAGSDAQGNDASCVLRISAGRHHILLTGDIERAAEMQMLEGKAIQEADVVVVPHHGSRTSSHARFVDKLNPELAVISAAYGNRWGLPHDEVVRRWRAGGAEVLNTATDGAVSMTVCEQGGISAKSRHRALRRRIWHE